MLKRKCAVCNGTGTQYKDRFTYLICWRCVGDGTVNDNPSNTIDMKNPPKTEDGDGFTRDSIQKEVDDDTRTSQRGY